MTKITEQHLDDVVARLNRVAGTPATPYTKHADGSFTANALNYHLSKAYGGVMLAQMSNKPGYTGISTPLGAYHRPKRELYYQLQAYIAGMEAAES